MRTYVQHESSTKVPVEEVQREIEFGFSTLGKVWQGEWASVETLLLELFPKVKRKKKKGSR
jgi:hypothetical protein